MLLTSAPSWVSPDVPALLTTHKADSMVNKPPSCVSKRGVQTRGGGGQTLPWAAVLHERPTLPALTESPGWQMGTQQLRGMATASLPAEPASPLASALGNSTCDGPGKPLTIGSRLQRGNPQTAALAAWTSSASLFSAPPGLTSDSQLGDLWGVPLHHSPPPLQVQPHKNHLIPQKVLNDQGLA